MTDIQVMVYCRHIEDYWSDVDQQQIAVHLTALEIFQAFMSLLYEVFAMHLLRSLNRPVLF